MPTLFPIHLVLSKFSSLNVTGRVPRKPREFVGSGGFGDIYRGDLRPACIDAAAENEDGENTGPLVVAIKSIRASLMNDNTFEKVCPWVTLCQIIAPDYAS